MGNNQPFRAWAHQTQVDERHAKSLMLAKKDFPSETRCILLSQDALPREAQSVSYLPWHEFLHREFPCLV
jgi:hypothetical protein